MKVVSIISRKGGVGKTATAQALSAGLMLRGYSVLCIDLDSQCNLTYSLSAMGANVSSFDILTGRATADQAIIHTAQGDIIPASESLAEADITIIGTGKEYRLKEALSGINYDYVIIDTPAALGTLTINALTASDSVIIPVQADIYSLQGIGQLFTTIDTVKKYCNSRLSIDGILITRFNGRTIISRDMLNNLEEPAAQAHTKLYSMPIRECISIREAQATAQSIFEYAPQSNAAKDYASFVDEFLKREREIEYNATEKKL